MPTDFLAGFGLKESDPAPVMETSHDPVEVMDAAHDRASGFKLNLSRGKTIGGRVSSEWISRPDDERSLLRMPMILSSQFDFISPTIPEFSPG